MAEAGHNVRVRSQLFLLAGLVAPLVFFSLSDQTAGLCAAFIAGGGVAPAGDRLALFVRQGSKNSWAMRSTGLLLLLLSTIGVVYAERFSHLSWRWVLLVVSPVLFAGMMAAAVGAKRRTAAAVLIALSVLAAVTLSLDCVAARLTERETVRELMISADNRGYGSAPVFMFEEIERTAEFYAAGRLAYAPDGEPVRFELVSEVVKQARQAHGPILVIMRPGAVSQLTNSRELRPA